MYFYDMRHIFDVNGSHTVVVDGHHIAQDIGLVFRQNVHPIAVIWVGQVDSDKFVLLRIEVGLHVNQITLAGDVSIMSIIGQSGEIDGALDRQIQLSDEPGVGAFTKGEQVDVLSGVTHSWNASD